MKNKILGVIGILWGGGILVYGLLHREGTGDTAYQSGQTAGLVFGAILLIVGLFYLVKGLRKGRDGQ